MRLIQNGQAAFGLWVLSITFALGVSSAFAGTIGGPFTVTTDTSTNIGPTNTYTHLLDFISDGSPASINTVNFTAANTSGANWSTTNFGGSVDEGSYNGGGLLTGAVVGSGAEKLLKDFYYNGRSAADLIANPTETLTLTGLTQGVTYETHVYYRAWDTSNRSTIVKFDEGGGLDQSITVDQNAPQASAKYLSYTFTAGASGSMTMSYSLNTAVQNNASWHNYGVTNQVVPEPATLSVLGLAGAGVLARRRRS